MSDMDDINRELEKYSRDHPIKVPTFQVEEAKAKINNIIAGQYRQIRAIALLEKKG